MNNKHTADAAVQPAPLGLAERRADPADHFGVADTPTARTSSRPTSGSLTLNSVLSQRWLNELRVQIGRDFEAQQPEPARRRARPSPAASPIGMPNFLPRPKYPDERRYQFIDNVTWYAGAHSVKTGIDINYVRERHRQPVPGRRHLRVSEPQRDRRRTARSAPAAARRRSPARPSDLPSLHELHPGVRPARQRAQRRRLLHDDRLQLLRPGQLARQQAAHREPRAALRVPEVAAAREDRGQGRRVHRQPGVSGDGEFNQDKNNCGPRVGFTYDVNGHHTTVLRGGWGIYYGRTSNSADFELADQQRGHVRDLQLSRPRRRARRIPEHLRRAAERYRASGRRFSTSRPTSSGPRSTWAS